MITNEQLEAFCVAVHAKIKTSLDAGITGNAERVHGLEPCTFDRGPKFARIVRNDSSTRSVFCFVDLETGAIYKAAGWKAPEPKHHVRGNIANGAADVGPYGPAYMR